MAKAREEMVARIKAANDAALDLAGTAEWAVLEEAKATLKNAKATALAEDMVVSGAAEAVKAARKKVRGLKAAMDRKRLRDEAKALEESVVQRERDLATHLARGEAPQS